MSLPKGFNDLKIAELRRSAIEDFAVMVESNDNKEIVIAKLAEAGVDWAGYVAQHPEVAPAPVVEEVVPVVVEREPEQARPGAVVTTEVMNPEEGVVVVQEAPKLRPQDKLLVKMERDNPLFEIRGYRFSKKSPYQLINSKDADYILRQNGFRQAYPNELQEFYS